MPSVNAICLLQVLQKYCANKIQLPSVKAENGTVHNDLETMASDKDMALVRKQRACV